MPSAFIPDRAEGIESVIQCHLTGEEASDWVIAIKEKACTVTPGQASSPNLILTVDSQDYKDLIFGRLDPTVLFMKGKLKLEGNLPLAMSLVNLFKVH
jgi:3-hydroxyacyl-CoA dehydrogenase/3a,7a,12a-trihydroxy-5b-cholest-24-enoyl-CoA hydratase